MGRVQRHRHQQRTYLRLEEAGHPATLLLVALGMVEDAKAVVGQGGHHFVVQNAVLLVDQLMGLRRQVHELLAGLALCALANQLQPVREPDLEELVQVGRDDGDVAQAFQQGHIGASGLGQHAAVEGQQRSFAIDHEDAFLQSFGTGWNPAH